MKIREIIIYGDSPSLSRPTNLVDISNTYYWKLIHSLGYECGLENRSIGGISIKKIRKKYLMILTTCLQIISQMRKN